MRSFASLLVVIALGASSVQIVRADTSSARTLYTDALLRERALRHDLETRRSDEPEPALLKRMRTLVKSYEQMSRQFPSSAYMDNALWQGALLAADAFWTFGEAEDKTTALEMFSELGSRFPKSSLVKDLPPHVKRLKAAKPTAGAGIGCRSARHNRSGCSRSRGNDACFVPRRDRVVG